MPWGVKVGVVKIHHLLNSNEMESCVVCSFGLLILLLSFSLCEASQGIMCSFYVLARSASLGIFAIRDGKYAWALKTCQQRGWYLSNGNYSMMLCIYIHAFMR